MGQHVDVGVVARLEERPYPVFLHGGCEEEGEKEEILTQVRFI
jgi:hypothetical protein